MSKKNNRINVPEAREQQMLQKMLPTVPIIQPTRGTLDTRPTTVKVSQITRDWFRWNLLRSRSPATRAIFGLRDGGRRGLRGIRQRRSDPGRRVRNRSGWYRQRRCGFVRQCPDPSLHQGLHLCVPPRCRWRWCSEGSGHCRTNPHRRWRDQPLEAGKLTIKTISGDASFEGAKCSEASFKSASLPRRTIPYWGPPRPLRAAPGIRRRPRPPLHLQWLYWSRLSAAAESGAKVELIEELSDNLYSRWQDLISNGMDEEAGWFY